MEAKGPSVAPTYTSDQTSSLRIGILHTRWNAPIVQSLLDGCLKTITAAGVPRANIVVQSVPGSYELPFAVQRMYTASTTSAASGGLVSAATDLLGVSGSAEGGSKPAEASSAGATGPFDAIIAIGVLIKGSTMHFEYIAEATTHGLMRVQLDTGVPVVFGVLTCMNEEQAHTRAGLRKPTQDDVGKEGEAVKAKLSHGESGHNHGEDWGSAAVEMAVKRRGWGEGKFVD